MDSSTRGSSVREILQARILEWVAMPFLRGSSWPKDTIRISGIAGRFFLVWAPGKPILLKSICICFLNCEFVISCFCCFFEKFFGEMAPNNWPLALGRLSIPLLYHICRMSLLRAMTVCWSLSCFLQVCLCGWAAASGPFQSLQVVKGIRKMAVPSIAGKGCVFRSHGSPERDLRKVVRTQVSAVHLGLRAVNLWSPGLCAQSCLTLCNPMDCIPPVLCPWDFPGKNTGVGCHFLLQGIFPTQGSNIVSCTGRRILYWWTTREAPDLL